MILTVFAVAGIAALVLIAWLVVMMARVARHPPARAADPGQYGGMDGAMASSSDGSSSCGHSADAGCSDGGGGGAAH